MASTKRIVEAGSTHGGVLELGSSGETVQFADGADIKFADIGTIAAAGSAQGDATAIVDTVTYVTAADGTKGVKLPTAAAGLFVTVYNTATSALPVYPNTSDDINDGTTNAAITLPGKSMATFYAIDGTTWAASYPTVWVAADTTLADGTDFIIGTSTGTKIGTGATQKIGFWNATPVVQPSSADQADPGAMTTVGANTGTAGAGLSLIGDTTAVNQATNLMNDLVALQEDITALDTLVTAIRTALVNAGIMKGSA